MNPQLAAAFAALGQQLAGLSTEVAALSAAVAGGGGGPNPSGAPNNRVTRSESYSRAADPTAALTRVFSVFSVKLLAIFGPLVALGTVLSQTSSGVGVFQKSIQVLGASIAPLLLPVFVMLAAAILTVSDNVWNQLLPNLKKWYSYILDEGLPNLIKFVDAVRDATGWLIKFAKDPYKEGNDAIKDVPGFRELQPAGRWLGGQMLPDWLKERTKDNGEVIPGIPQDQIGKRDRSPFSDARRRELLKLNPNYFGAPQDANAPGTPSGGGFFGGGMGFGLGAIGKALRGAGGVGAAAEPPPAEPKSNTRADMLRNMNLVMQSLRMGMGSQASIGGVADLQNKAQMAAIQQDPLQQKVLQRTLTAFDEMIKALSEIEKNTEKKPAPNHPGRKWAPGEWDTSGDF